ncbi:zinc finger protein 292b [Menidia menidia]
MADGEAQHDCFPAGGFSETIRKLSRRLEKLQEALVIKSVDSPFQSSSDYCHEFCSTLLECAGCWRIEEEPWPVVQVYIVALLSYARASPYLSPQCDSVSLVAERLSLSFVELLLSTKDIPDVLWKELKSSVQVAHSKLLESGITQFSILCSLSQYDGIWTNRILQGLLTNTDLQTKQVEEFLVLEGMVLLQMRVKQLMKENQFVKAAFLAKTCADYSAFQGKGTFKQMYLVSLCKTSEQNRLMAELSKEDCHDAIDMICNLESDGDDSGAFGLCSAFLTRQLLQGDAYCAWELTLLWSKLLRRLEPSEQIFLDRCHQMSLLSTSAYHILFLIKVIQSEIDQNGLQMCIEMCIRALQIKPDDGKTKATVCKTISCLLPADLEVKRACQLTEFLLEPTVDAYYAVETLYNEPDQRLEEENMPILNSLRCELLLLLKTQWSFDPEFWDWKTLKRHCLELMGEEASIVSSIDSLNDAEKQEEDCTSMKEFRDHVVSDTYELKDFADRRIKNREMKKLREKGFISARFRNWQAYMQYCVLCDKEFLGHRLVRHAQTHLNSGIYTCPICAQTFTSKDAMIPHVTSHVKLSCKERLTAMKANHKLANPKTAAPAIAAFKIKTLNDRPKNGYALDQNEIFVKNIHTTVVGCDTNAFEVNMCPVGKCRRNFKFVKNLIAHVKAHRENEEAKTFLEMQSKKVVCQYCRRHFVSVTHLNDHLQVHCGVKPYICIQLNCKASFLSNTELLIHRKTHSIFKARCMFPNCGKIFNAAFKLYDHEAQHFKMFTCKVADCGKVFHSQQQLDLHEDLHHSTCEGQHLQNVHSGPALSCLTMPSNQSVFDQETSQRSLKTEMEEISTNGNSPVAVETLLKSTHELVENWEQSKVKPEPLNTSSSSCQTCSRSTSVIIKAVHSHFLEPNRQRDDSNDYITALQNNPLVPHFETNVEHVLQSQPQLFPSKVNTDEIGYNSDYNLPSQLQEWPTASGNCSAGALSECPGEPASSQSLPPLLSTGQVTGNILENSETSSNGTGPCQKQRERFHCPFETCTRHYSSYRSVTKHMKAVHSDFYEQWQVKRAKIKTTYVPALSISSVEQLSSFSTLENKQASSVPALGNQRQNVIQWPPHTDGSARSSRVNLHSSSLAHDQNSSLLMVNVSNPIVLSQLGADRLSATEQSRVLSWKNLPFFDEREQIHNSESPHGCPSKPHVNSTSGTPPTPVSSCSVTASMINQMEYVQSRCLNREAQSVITSNVNCAKEALHQAELPPSGTSQLSLASSTKTLEKIKARENSTQSSYSSLIIECQNMKNNQPQNGLSITEKDCGNRNQPRTDKRSKCPAIIKDGKFVCRRCFRQFDSPKSLGGHLSKRTTCKPYQELVKRNALTGSFLNLLNSELSHSDVQVYLKTSETETSSLPDVKDYSSPKDSTQTCGRGQSNDDILKQIMTESNLADLFVQMSVPQSLQNFQAGLFKQHAEHGHPVQEGYQQWAAHYPQQHINKTTGKSSEQLLPRNLTEHSSTSIPDRIMSPGEHRGEGHLPDPSTQHVRSDSVERTALPNSQLSEEIEKPRLTEKDIKRRLREQILSGDFQRRSSMCYSAHTDTKASAVSSGPGCSPFNHCGINQLSNIAKNHPYGKGHVTKGSLGESDQFPNTQSFKCCRETVGKQPEIPSPAIIFEHDPDPKPSELSISMQQCISELQCAFEGLGLAKEMTAVKSTSVHQNCGQMNNQTAPSNVRSHQSVSTTFAKPYACDSVHCRFSSFSGEALWKHLSKAHNYTLEMVNVVKKRYGQYARFKCQKCDKAFTRNSNLRSHYLSAHKLSAKEISDLDNNRKLTKAAASPAFQNQPAGTATMVQKAATQQVDSSPPPGAQSDGKFVLYDNIAITNQKSQDDKLSAALLSIHNQKTTPPAQAQTLRGFGSMQEVSAKYWIQDERNLSEVHSQHRVSDCFPPFSQELPTPLAQDPLTHKTASFSRQTAVNPVVDIAVKTEVKSPKASGTFSPYRPYRCVHRGCVAAFTIQHNLILHYRAVHQSAFSALEVNKELNTSEGLDQVMDHEEQQPEFPQIFEFRCQVKDCCCVFQEVPNLFQHYFQLHKFSFERVGSLLSQIELGKFLCGHKGCTETFTAFWGYVGHVKEQHKDLNLTKPEQLNISFRCEIEGCDRSYATKSNMLRHVMKKHQDLYQPKLKIQKVKEDGTKQNSQTLHYSVTKTSNGKENIESNQKNLLRVKTKRGGKSKTRRQWDEYGNPSLKSKLEASALCTKKFPLQYPCMIKGCELVMKSERGVFKHYGGHGLSDKYLEQHRGHFIFCKKVRQKCHSVRSDDSKSDYTSDASDNEMAAPSCLGGGRGEKSQPVLRRRGPAGASGLLFDKKLPNDGSSNSSVPLKRKRGRPRKLIEKIVKRKKTLHVTKTEIVYGREAESQSSFSTHTEQCAAFKPMGFEMSFLKFLEQSSEYNVTRTVTMPEKGEIRAGPGTRASCVKFSNRQNLKSLSNVRIKLDAAFSKVSHPMLRQLQDMRPAVILEQFD